MLRIFILFVCLSNVLFASPPILHLKGTPYERGLQHGNALKTQIENNIATFINQKGFENNERMVAFQQQLPLLLSHVPPKYMEELKGIADGSDIPFEKLLILNLFPELFHCSAVTVKGDMTVDGSLYHVRVLDYNIGKHLQNSTVLMVVEPTQGIPYVSVSYAGFIGAITGMNQQKISIGEIGGKGYGSWNGMPMAFLLRELLEQAKSLDEAKEILSSTHRTCEYFYIVSDGKIEDSFAALATHDKLQFIEPGVAYSIQDLTETISLSFEQLPHSLALTGFSRPERYTILQERLTQNKGKIDAVILQEIVKKPIANEDNLHTAIFHPSTLRVWVAHAGPANEPAYTQPYQLYSLEELLESAQ